MLRITEIGTDTLRLEGRLTGPWVDELRRLAAARPGPLQLDLSGLTFADAAGAALLKDLAARGVVIRDSSRFLEQLLREGGA
jgi:anti-anti-sigma regulatory factor